MFTQSSILEDMKLVANIQLKPSIKQDKALFNTLERSNQACNYISEKGFESKVMHQYDLHKLFYKEVRNIFGLAAQVAVRCIAKVADAYKINKDKQVTFRNHAAQPYDDRIFRFCSNDTISIWTLEGRQKIPFACGDRQRELLKYRKGEADLMYIRGKWFLACVCDVPDPEEIGIKDILGVDFGVVNIAFDSLGNSYSGETIEKVRQKFSKRRANLQRINSKAAKRKLKRLSGKEARFRKHTNHCISKEIVASAERLSFAVAIENLTGIRKRIKASKAQRSRLHGWSFAQLRTFVTYKAKIKGIPIIAINPRNTSRTCPECGLIDKRNRKTQATFSCISCGYTNAADFVGARNIRASGVACKPALCSQLLV